MHVGPLGVHEQQCPHPFTLERLRELYEIDVRDGCWLVLPLDKNVYVSSTGSRMHRNIAEWHAGRKLARNELGCHTCDNKRCVNPKHIYVGTFSNNMSDSIRNGKYRNSGSEFLRAAALERWARNDGSIGRGPKRKQA